MTTQSGHPKPGDSVSENTGGGPLPNTVTIRGANALRGTVRTPGDKSISHRALLIAALAEGTSVIDGLSNGDDVARTRNAIAALGAEVTFGANGPVVVTGGRERLHASAKAIDCANSGTGMRLLAGVVAGLPGRTVLSGDSSLSVRPMDRIAEPLGLMGAPVNGRGEHCLPPITIDGGALRGIEWTPPVASAQIKSCVLFAGLAAAGETVVREAVATRAHTEEMLATAGADIRVEADGAGRVVRLRASRLEPHHFNVPGDPSQAAFWVVAACLVPGSAVTVEHVYAGPERIGFVAVLQAMGADVAVVPGPEGTADLVARFGGFLDATVVEASAIPSLDEVPVLAVAATTARGTTTFKDVGELRIKETDRLAALVDLVTALGARAEIVGDDLQIEGLGAPDRLAHTKSESRGDHRMAMAATVAALAGGAGDSVIAGFEVVATSYPGFLDDLHRLSGPAAPSAAIRDVGAHAVAPVTNRAPPTDPAQRVLIAIDGPAGSGKSTVSKLLAARLGLERLDTGAMYRAVAWAALERGIDPADGQAVAAIARNARLEIGWTDTRIDGVDVSTAIRTPEVSQAVSVVAAIPAVRYELVQRQRRWAAEHGGGVVEGRDIGTVVFPRADVKVFLTASASERTRRRRDEPPGGVARRDRIDSTRAASPLAKADDAHLLDTTGRNVEDVVEEVLTWI